MDIKINNKYNEVFGILSNFNIIMNYEHFKVQVEEKWNMKFDADVEMDFKEISELPQLNTARNFVGMDLPTKNVFINYEMMKQSNSLREYFGLLQQQSEEKLRKDVSKLLGFEYSGKKTNEQDLKNFIDKVDQEDFDNEVKWFLLSLINDPMRAIGKFVELVNEFVPCYEKLKKKYWSSYEKFVEWTESKIQGKGTDFLDEHLEFLNLKQYDEIIINFSFFELASAYYFEDGTYHVFLGGMFRKYVEEKKDQKDVDKYLMVYKVLSDNTRFSIIQMLIKKECYGQEIAEKLGVSTATISYHMDYLLAASLIRMNRRNRRNYYVIQKDKIKKSIGFLERELNI